MNYHKRISQLNTDNRGVTLIEIIVSLLILIIIVVPLISSFAVAGKANKAAKDDSYAAAAAENVMEAVKVLGLEETVREFNNCGINPFSLIPVSDGVSYAEVAAADGEELPAVPDNPEDYVYVKRDKYEFNIENVKQGTNIYDVKLRLSTAGYSGGGETGSNLPNDYQFADLAAFDSESVAVINPMLSGASYDDKALRYFANMNSDYESKRYAEDCAAVDNSNRIKYQEYLERLQNDSSAIKPVEPVYDPDPSAVDYHPMPDAEVVNEMSKKITTKIDENIDDEGKKIYTINSELEYSCLNKNQEFDSTKPESELLHRPPYTGYCKNQHFSKLNTLFFIYDIFGEPNNLYKNTIDIIKNFDGPLNVYIVLQGAEGVDYGSVTTRPKVNISGTFASDITFFCQSSLEVNTPVIQNKTLIKKLDEGSKRLYNVDVEVYEAGTSYSKLVNIIKSTLIDDE